MNTSEMRKRLLTAYEGSKWTDRVQKMSDRQVYATYMRLKDTGRMYNR